MTDAAAVGSPVRRREDDAILRGAQRFAADIDVPGVLTMTFVRATEAHAVLDGIDRSEALALDGVHAVLVAADLGLRPQLPTFAEPMFDEAFRRPPLATDRIRFAGEILAVVVADDAAVAADAAGLVVIETTPLPVVVEELAAVAPEAELLFPAVGTNIALAAEFEGGERHDQDGLTEVRTRTLSQRIAPCPLEPLAIVVEPDGDRLTVRPSTQGPHGLRDHLATTLGLRADDVRVIAPATGGGFGAKTVWEVEYVLACATALRLQRPVRYLQDRSENLLTSHARGQHQDVRLLVDEAGRIHSLQVEVTAEAGAYPGIAAVLPMTTRSMATGVYAIPHVRWNFTSVVTNTSPVGAFRGAGRPEATSLIERAIDHAALTLGLDAAEIRRRNLIAEDAFPCSTVTGSTYDSGAYGRSLELLLDASGYAALRQQQVVRRRQGDAMLLGLGLCTYVEVTAPVGGAELGEAVITPEGRIEVRVGTSSHGQGHETTFAQIAADALGVPMGLIDVVQGDTGLVSRGGGTQGSRSVQLGGSAVAVAAARCFDQIRSLVAHRLEARPDDVVALGDGGFGIVGMAVPMADLAQIHEWSRADDRPADVALGCSAESDFAQQGGTYPFGAHLAVVEVDRETGRVQLVAHHAVDDAGTIVNPLLATGQAHGGIAAGAGQALNEDVRYDEHGNATTASLASYGFLSAADLPSFHTIAMATPSPRNPLGAKGIGESGTIGSIVSVQNAVVDALSHLGVRHVDMPCTPERVWSAVNAARATASEAPTAGARPTARHYVGDASPRSRVTGGRTGRRISPWP